MAGLTLILGGRRRLKAEDIRYILSASQASGRPFVTADDLSARGVEAGEERDYHLQAMIDAGLICVGEGPFMRLHSDGHDLLCALDRPDVAASFQGAIERGGLSAALDAAHKTMLYAALGKWGNHAG